MISGPFVELYAEARARDFELTARAVQPLRREGRSIWKQRLARMLVRMAAELDREQVQLELPPATA